MPRFYRLLEHTGDIAIEVTARSRRDLFQKTARAMMDVMVRPDRTPGKRRWTFEIHGETLVDLMKNWLGEVLYRFMGEGTILSQFKIEDVTVDTVRASAMGRRFQIRRDRLKTEIKAVTYHQLKVMQVGKTWKTRVIFDV